MTQVRHDIGHVAEIGHTQSFFEGVARVVGLPHVGMHEVLINRDGEEVALVIGYDGEGVDVLYFSTDADTGQPLYRSNKNFSIARGDESIGRIFDGLGRPLDGLGVVKGDRKDVFVEAPEIIRRKPVTKPLITGIKLIDTTLPIGRGQRELLIGDRKLGKSAIAVDTILHQKDADPPVTCVYVLVGHQEQKLRQLTRVFTEHSAFLYTTIVAAPAGASYASQYLAPFVGCAIAEYIRDNGRDALIVYDDLSKHAKAYRDISLLLESAPGREAYPGDIFSLHAGLLERAAQLSDEVGSGSLTALPIVETQEGDITSYIPTNIISITDGQIYLERGLFQKGFLPAVNVGLSVSRVGSQAQPKPLTEVTRGIRLALAQHKELQKLSQLETVVSDVAKKKIYRGELTLELLKQPKRIMVSWPEQTILFYAVEEGFFDDIDPSDWTKFEGLLLELVRTRYKPYLDRIRHGTFDDDIKDSVRTMVIDFKKEFLS